MWVCVCIDRDFRYFGVFGYFSVLLSLRLHHSNRSQQLKASHYHYILPNGKALHNFTTLHAHHQFNPTQTKALLTTYLPGSGKWQSEGNKNVPIQVKKKNKHTKKSEREERRKENKNKGNKGKTTRPTGVCSIPSLLLPLGSNNRRQIIHSSTSFRPCQPLAQTRAVHTKTAESYLGPREAGQKGSRKMV